MEMRSEADEADEAETKTCSEGYTQVPSLLKRVGKIPQFNKEASQRAIMLSKKRDMSRGSPQILHCANNAGSG